MVWALLTSKEFLFSRLKVAQRSYILAVAVLVRSRRPQIYSLAWRPDGGTVASAAIKRSA